MYKVQLSLYNNKCQEVIKMKYVIELSIEKQEQIKKELIAAGIKGEDLEAAMNSKIADLEEIIKGA